MNEVNERFDPETGEIMEMTETVSLAQQLTKAEIDQQIATAHRFPRSIQAVAKKTLELATFSPEAAAECNYALPRGGKSLTGPSIRLAEIIVSQFGNCRVGARVVHVDRFEKYVEAEGIFHDLESNSATTARVRRRIVDRNGNLFNDDMILVTGNAACSIAKRNAVLAAVPKALWMPAYEAALKVIKGNAKTLTERRDGALKALSAFGVTPDMICGALEIEGPLEISLDHMPTLIAWHKALKDGEQTVESLFPAPTGSKGEAPAKGTAGKLKQIAGKGGGQGAPKGQARKKAEGAKEPAGEPQKDKEKQGEVPAEDSSDIAPARGEPEGDGAEEPAAEDRPGDGDDTADAADEDEEPAVSDEEARAAFERGKAAYQRGMKQAACPKELRRSQRLFDAWNEGWEEAASENNKSSEGAD